MNRTTEGYKRMRASEIGRAIDLLQSEGFCIFRKEDVLDLYMQASLTTEEVKTATFPIETAVQAQMIRELAAKIMDGVEIRRYLDEDNGRVYFRAQITLAGDCTHGYKLDQRRCQPEAQGVLHSDDEANLHPAAESASEAVQERRPVEKE